MSLSSTYKEYVNEARSPKLRYIDSFMGKYVAGLVTALLVLGYLIQAYYCAYGYPLNLDDIAIFIDDFNDFFLEENGIKKLQYLFVLRHNQHINFPSRLINMITYLFSGKN